MKIKFFALGGTIDKIYFDAMSKYQVGPPRIKEILTDARVVFSYEVTSLLRKDSLDMTDDDRDMVFQAVRSETCNHIVITHGTDTMIETAMVLKKIKGKTIVFTGAMEPAGFKSSDATFNLGCAIGAVQTLKPGVYIAMNGNIFDPANARKNRELKQFEKKY